MEMAQPSDAGRYIGTPIRAPEYNQYKFHRNIFFTAELRRLHFLLTYREWLSGDVRQ
jgi:hypothetical protein